MLFALDYNNRRVHIDDTHSNQEYYCEDCGARLTVRKGDVRIHHFAHPTNQSCVDSWVTDRERKYDTSDWHNDWQSNYPLCNQEVRLSLGDTRHRADVMIGKTVVEFQHSIMSANAFEDRNKFYFNLGCKVIWLFDVHDLYSDGSLTYTQNGEVLNFRWKNPKKAFNAYDIKSGCIDLFLQISDDESACIVMVKDVSAHGFESFSTKEVMSKVEFLNYTGLSDGSCMPPDRDDLSANERYLAFKNKYDISLNKQQERALQSVEGANLLLAVPGSGKTTVLIDRIGFMVLVKDIPPNSILAITYNKSAAEEMKMRCTQKFGEDIANNVSFMTINAFSNGIYKSHINGSSGKPLMNLITDNKESVPKRRDIIRDLYKRIFKESFPTDSDIQPYKTALSYIKNMMLTDSQIQECDDDLPKLSEMYKSYQAVLKQNKFMDYDDQMVFAHFILSNYPNELSSLRSKYRYVCVDEAQDTSKIQHEIIRMLVGNNNLFMVGDEDQSIYGFRAAYPRALLNFRYDYNNPYILCMVRNYRSTPQIVEKAQQFISKNKGRYEKHMVAERGNGCPVQLHRVKTRKEQYDYILEVAKNRQQETAFLYRDNDSAVILTDLLLRNGIPFRLKEPEANFFGNRIIKDIVAFLSLAINPYDIESFKTVCNKNVLYIKKEDKEWVLKNCANKRCTVLDTLEKRIMYMKEENSKKRAKKFIKLITSLAKTNPATAITRIYDEGYKRYVQENHLDYGKIEILKILSEQEPDIAKFLERLKYLEPQFTSGFYSEEENPIILSTIHSSKGLEYDSVYMVDVYDGRFPSAKEDAFHRAKDSSDGGQEDRRLFYVGITRAKSQLTLIAMESHRSTFIEELFPEMVERPSQATVVKSTTTSFSSPAVLLEQLKRQCIEEETRLAQKAEEVKRQQAEKEKQLDEDCYQEVCERFTQQNHPIRDHTGRRWVKCELCGVIKRETEFPSYGGINHVNLGICSDCSRNR